MSSKTPPQNSAKAKKLGGDQLPIKARLVQLIISGDEENPLIKVSLYRRDFHMNRILTIVLAIIIMGYSIYSWNDTSEQSMLILQTLLGFMLVSLGVQNLKITKKKIEV